MPARAGADLEPHTPGSIQAGLRCCGELPASGDGKATGMSLYRKAAIEAQATAPYGKIILIQPLSSRLLTLMALAFAALVVGFIIWGSYTRHSTVAGQLLPDAGLIKVYSPRIGVVLERRVQENQQVQAGDVLFVVSGEPAAGNAGEGLHRELDLGGGASHGDRRLLVSKVAELQRQLDILGEQIDNQKSRVQLSQNAVDAYKGLLAKKYISAEQLQQKQEDLLDQRARLQALDRERVALTHELGTQYVVVTATQPGTATALTAEVGQTVDGQRPMLCIVPAQSRLHAELFAPSRAVGFIRPGDRVLLRYQAYPYQKFGHHTGEVSWVAKTAMAPADLANFNQAPDRSEPLYQIRVKLDQQDIMAYGKPQPLQSGMVVEADIVQERRRLYEWILDPLLTLSGRV